MIGIHVYELIPLTFLVLPPILIGFLWMRPDAEAHGQPGLVWALLTIPLSWIAVLAYVIVRALTSPNAAR
jgi:hypothetical protein